METLGYTKITWDNESGDQKQPWAAIQFWSALSVKERRAALYLGWAEATWNNVGGNEPQPPINKKFWDEISVCGEYNFFMQCLANSVIQGHSRMILTQR